MNAGGTEPREALREALRMQENACAAEVPPFASIAARIAADEPPLDAPRWGVGKSARLAAALVASQLRVMPNAVLPAALVVAAAATAAACFIASGWGAEGATWWFSAFLLFGVALTVTAALSPDRFDALALAMPLGPQTVTLARLAAVLGVDAAAGLAASAAFAWHGASLDLAVVVVTWLVPLFAVAGVSALAAVWTGSAWAAVAAGAIAVPLALPAAQALDGGTAALLSMLPHAAGPESVVAAGVALLAAAVLTARRAAVAHLQTA